MKVHVVSGSRADRGLLAWPIKALKEAGMLAGNSCMTTDSFIEAARYYARVYEIVEADAVLMLGDRWEILAAATQAHLQRIPIVHIGGGDVTEGSYDDAMRDCISRMASMHFVTSTSAMARLTQMGCRNVHLVGNPGIDYIKHADWKRERPIGEPYVVVSYQPETIDGTNELASLVHALDKNKLTVFIQPNADLGSDEIRDGISRMKGRHVVHESLPHDEFLNLIFHCDEFIGNSSAMLYEAPELGIKTRMIGKRQRGRTIPWGDGNASQRIVNILRYAHV